ncbi:MAG: abortive infection family protein [Verrucomicrobiota bacterium]|jgi:hypothetical protein
MAADIYSYDKLPDPLKRQIIAVWFELVNMFPAFDRGNSDKFFALVAKELWVRYNDFEAARNARSMSEAVCNYFGEQQDAEKCLEIVEIVFACLAHFYRRDSYVNAGLDYDIHNAKKKLNSFFQEHAVGYEFRGDKILRIDSGVMHKEVVAPAMALLQEPYLKGANEEFLKAHEHFRHARYGECINECLKAFESTMKAICEKRGWQYNQTDTAKSLLATCEQNGLFPTFMQSSLSGLRSVLENVATVRNKLSGHGQGAQQVQISEEVAAFAIHSTGANILFLASLEKNLR